MTQSHPDATYRGIIQAVLRHGTRLRTRNSNCARLRTIHSRFDRSPLIGIRKTAWKNALREWEWFMSGSSYIHDLHPAVRHWWQPWADKNGHVAHNYSEQFTEFGGDAYKFDQIEYFLDGIRKHPNSRRNVITTWHTAQMADPKTPITNCHSSLVQAFVEPDNSLHLVTYQRSADVICGVPHNWIQMWAFLMWLAHRTGRGVGSLTWIGGDVHIYEAHYELANKILGVVPTSVPELVYTPSSDAFLADDFSLSGTYTPALTDRAEMIV